MKLLGRLENSEFNVVARDIKKELRRDA